MRVWIFSVGVQALYEHGVSMWAVQQAGVGQYPMLVLGYGFLCMLDTLLGKVTEGGQIVALEGLCETDGRVVHICSAHVLWMLNVFLITCCQDIFCQGPMHYSIQVTFTTKCNI